MTDNPDARQAPPARRRPTMNPVVKYTLGRVGMFAAVLLVVLPTTYHPLLKLLAAVLVSAVLSWFLLRPWRERASVHLEAAARRRRADRERLRDTLAGNDDGMT